MSSALEGMLSIAMGLFSSATLLQRSNTDYVRMTNKTESILALTASSCGLSKPRAAGSDPWGGI